MSPNLLNRKNLILAGSILIIIIIVILGLVARSRQNTPQTTNTPAPNERYDANSGDTISAPDSKGPDTYGQADSQPIFLGLAPLLDYGPTLDQVSSLKDAFTAFSSTQKKPFKEISVTKDSISPVPHDPDKTSDSINFKVIIDQSTTYQATFEYFDLVSARLYLYQPGTSTLIHDSGVINPSDGD